jgi:hypothetical protein
MGAKEYWGRWQTQSDRIHIAGTKRGGRVRDVPLLERPRCRGSRAIASSACFASACSVITPYDLRRTYSSGWSSPASRARGASSTWATARRTSPISTSARSHGVSRRGREEAARVPRTRFLTRLPRFLPRLPSPNKRRPVMQLITVQQTGAAGLEPATSRLTVAWEDANLPKRSCEICGGRVRGRLSIKYCKACKPVAQRVQIAKSYTPKKK